MKKAKFLYLTAALLVVCLFLAGCFQRAELAGENDLFPIDGEIKIQADNDQWTDTDYSVNTGWLIEIQAEGLIGLGADGEKVSPDGIDDICGEGCPDPDGKIGALTGKVGVDYNPDCIFEVGADYQGQAQCAGELFLIVNDYNYTDNSGYFTATVEITEMDDDDDTNDDDDEIDYQIPECAPDPGIEKDGVLYQMVDGGTPGYQGVSVVSVDDGTKYVAATRGLNLILYTKPLRRIGNVNFSTTLPQNPPWSRILTENCTLVTETSGT